MKHSRALLTVTAAVIACVALAGCSSSSPNGDTSSTKAAHGASTPIPTVTPTTTTPPHLDQQVYDNILITAYTAGTYTSTKPCKCSLRVGGANVDDVYPAGSSVWVLRLELASSYGDTRSVAGTTISGSFPDRPDSAVIDTAEGPAWAAAHHEAWLADGMFTGKQPHELVGDKPRDFVVAVRIPAGVTELDLNVDIPSEGGATRLTLPISGELATTTSTEGE